ncbi:hypothetical protein [Streptomyces sp. NPDC091215]|uniref:hypothetical protein n=1 Tax=Streptomyces sp. NPDC091215 TaxID=3155192 RepID=UPI0034140F30
MAHERGVVVPGAAHGQPLGRRHAVEVVDDHAQQPVVDVHGVAELAQKGHDLLGVGQGCAARKSPADHLEDLHAQVGRLEVGQTR